MTSSAADDEGGRQRRPEVVGSHRDETELIDGDDMNSWPRPVDQTAPDLDVGDEDAGSREYNMMLYSGEIWSLAPRRHLLLLLLLLFDKPVRPWRRRGF